MTTPWGSTLLLLHVTEVQFDFDKDDLTVEEQQEVVDSVVGKTYEVLIPDADDPLISDGEKEDALVLHLTELTSCGVVSVSYRQVTDNYPELVGNVPLEGLTQSL